MASSAGAVITPPAYVGPLLRKSGASLDEGEDTFLEEQGVHRLREVVVCARVAGLLLDARTCGSGEQHQGQRGGASLSPEETDHLDAGEVGQHLVDEDTVVVAVAG